ncbi:DNA-binding response regulator [Pseudohongiella nitratireducens]|uniref:DNA-binding response regulator n=1 Tax=Pseudohongiella nitratireducens TaxID=1768907 RepID=A0A916QMI1_9GAMM|nr:response regulator [Pseudohongiella nitratireducens]MDF1623943.1 response regulator [Pseudohongiella nitratireducens]GFZ80074.1 DNA-binding response regulator [Pseudohongiella nitratireducens]|tara:strand:- start:5520 stop:6176 length:657 start_codon:yes stop_codon:yes gene_type:complete
MRVLLVEDDSLLGKATAEGLRMTFAVDWCTSAEDAKKYMATSDYDAITLDINLPGQSGLSFLQDVRRHLNTVPVILLTARDAVQHRVEGLNLGADDYLTKPFDLDELTARLYALIRRSQGRTTPELKVHDITFYPEVKQVRKAGSIINLSGRELAVLEVLMSNIDRVINKSQIESHIYDWDNNDIESNTIEVHISGLRRKLGKELIKTVRGVGYTITQ